MTRDEFIAMAIEKAAVGAGEDATGFFTDIADIHVEEALQGFAELIARNPMRAHLLQAITPIALNLDPDGSADITTGPGAALITDLFHLGRITDANGNQLDWVAHFADFQLPHQSPFGKYTLQGKKIFARAPNGILYQDGTFEAAASPLQVRAAIKPTANDLVPELQDDATRFFADLLIAVRAKAGSKAPGTSQGRGEV